MRARDVTVTGSWKPEQAIHYALSIWGIRGEASVKRLHPRVYLVAVDDIEFVVVVTETRCGYRVKLVEESIGKRMNKVM